MKVVLISRNIQEHRICIQEHTKITFNSETLKFRKIKDQLGNFCIRNS